MADITYAPMIRTGLECHDVTMPPTFSGGVSASTFAPKNRRETSSSSSIGKSVWCARVLRPERVSKSSGSARESVGGG